MNIADHDLNLLILFKTVFEERNLSRAARRLHLSQPALSHRLNKLREELADPLFVRTPRGVSPTPLALSLAPEIETLVADLETFYQNRQASDFFSERAIIRIYTTDYTEQLLLPGLLPRISVQAPNLTLVCHNTRGQLPSKELEAGECDLAIAGFFGDLPASYFQQIIYREGFVCVVNRNNPRFKNGLDLETYVASPHILTTLTGDLDGLVDRQLREMGISRRVVAGLSSFTVPLEVVREGDFVVTCLQSLGEKAVGVHSELALLPCPLPMKSIQLAQVWHRRTHRDGLRSWVRGAIKSYLEGLEVYRGEDEAPAPES